jgi:Protein of unknown function (DUF1353)
MGEQSSTVCGRYLGRLVWEPLPDGRLMRLTEPFGFLDENQIRWPVPSMTDVDGASIPRVLWPFIGGPFEGKYRYASVIHDYYCDTRRRPWRMVHRVFYNAMRVSGTKETLAKLMYAGVLFGGPRWSDTVEHNVNLPPPDLNMLLSVAHSKFEKGVIAAVHLEEETSAPPDLEEHVTLPNGKVEALDLKKIEGLIADHNPSLDEIDKAIDAGLQLGRWMT